MMKQKQRVLLVGVNINNQPNYIGSMEELKNLTIACELEVVGQIEQNLKAVNPAYYIGSGKVDEVRSLIEERKAEVLMMGISDGY